MAISLGPVEVRHERRLRLSFTNTVAIGAFNTALYTVTCDTDDADAPGVSAALLVPGSPTTVELALTNALVQGSRYKVTAVGVPATDLSVTPAGSEEFFTYGVKLEKTLIEPRARDRERLLYQCDLIWNGQDYEETATGDLARIEGRANVTKSLGRGIETSGLPWNPAWGVDVREFVDSPSTTGGTLRGTITAQILSDGRVKSVSSEININLDTTTIIFTPILKSGEAASPVSAIVPNS